MPIFIHPEAAKRFDEIARALVRQVIPLNLSQPQADKYDLHPVATVTERDVIGKIEYTTDILDSNGLVIGRESTVNGRSYGLVGSGFTECQDLAGRLAGLAEIQESVSIKFACETALDWIFRAFWGTQAETLTQFLAARCEREIKDYEIWTPIFQTYSSQEFSLGDVRFKPISKEMLDRRFANAPDVPKAKQYEDKTRSKLQSVLAACIQVKAENEKAHQIARAKAYDSTALLRFLSTTNLHLNSQSYCLPLGRERVEISNDLDVSDGSIATICQSALKRGPVAWDIDRERTQFPHLLSLLDKLASGRTASKYQSSLYDALLLYGRNSVATEAADKLVFVLVALESMLLKNTSEFIKKSIGVRIAWLTGNTREERIAIAENVEHVYDVRSRFIHHGDTVQDIEPIDRFLYSAWLSFNRLLERIDTVSTKQELIAELDAQMFGS